MTVTSRRLLALLALVLAPAFAGLRASQAPAALASACEFDNVERIVAVGDVHSAYDRLLAILRAAAVIDTRNRWIGGRTHLVQTGDVLDRGPDSRRALEFLRRLAGEIGTDRLVWASDCPFVGEEAHISYQGTIDWLKQALPDPSVQRKVMSQNAITLYGFDDAA